MINWVENLRTRMINRKKCVLINDIYFDILITSTRKTTVLYFLRPESGGELLGQS